MRTCPTCGAAAENEDAPFCTGCGGAIAAAPEASGGVSTPPDRHDAAVPSDAPATPAASSEVQAHAEYVQAVQKSLADGLLDAADRARLERVRVERQLSAQDTARLESQAKALVMGQSAPSDATATGTVEPVVLEINDSHFYMEKFAAVLDFRLLNQAASLVTDVCVTAAGQHLGRAECKLASLGRGRTRQMLQVRPQCAGEHVVEIALRFRADDEVQEWSAQCLLRVLARNEPISNVKLIIDQSEHITGEKIGFGQSIRKEVNSDITKGLIREVNDLIKRAYPESWQPLQLRPMASGEPGRVQIVPQLATRGPALERAALVAQKDGGEQRILLLGQADVRFGRKRGSSDILLRILPRSKENDDLSLRIQARQPHLTLSLDTDGLWLTDHETANGTKLDGRAVKGRVRLPLTQAVLVSVGQALELRLMPIEAAPHSRPIIVEHYAALGVPDELWRTAEALGLCGVLIERVNNLTQEERYVLVYRWVDWAYTTGGELRPTGNGAETPLFRVLRLGGRLWLECGDPQTAVSVSDVPVGVRHAAPVAAGLILRAGDAAFAIQRFEQISLA